MKSFIITQSVGERTIFHMTTEALFLPPLGSGLKHISQESSEVDEFRQMVGTKNVVEDVSITSEPSNPLIPPLEDASSLIAKKNTVEELSNLIQKDAPVEKTSSPVMLSQGMDMAPVYNQLDQGQEASRIKMPNVCSEQQKEESTSCQLAQGETGSCLECHDNILNVFPEFKHSNGTSIQEVQGVETNLYHCSDKVPVVPADFLKPLECVQKAKKNPLVYDGTISDVASEQQTSKDISNQPDQKIEDDTVDHSVQSFDVYSDSPEKPELSSSLKQIPACEEKSEGLTSPKSLNLLCLETNCQNQTGEGECFISSHSNFDLTGELQGTFHPTNIHEEIKSSCQKITETGNEEIMPNRENDLLPSENYQNHVNEKFLRKALEDNSQATDEQVTQDSSSSPNSSSLALAGSKLDVDICCQQRASGTGCDTLPQKQSARSPVATNDSCGPAHQGLAPVCDGQDREGLAIHESRGAGNNNQSQGEVGAECVLESERQKEATRDSEPGENTSQPEEAENLTGANKLDKAFPDSQSLTGTSNPTCPREAAGAMVLASVEDLLDTRNRADSRGLANASLANGLDITTENSGLNPTPRKGLLLDVADPTSSRDLVSPEDPTLAAPPAEEHLVTEESDCPTDLMGNNTYEPENPSHTTETPIEREIRVHLEREELLRRERGLGSSRGTQEYVEVCIKPILNQSMASSIKPKEKERQWAGVQMQREIQRECRREEDLVQLGKVRGTYDRGTPQELQEKKMIFEQYSHPETPDFKKVVHSSGSNSCTENARGPSFAELNRMSNMIILDSGVLAEPKQHTPGRASLASPFFCLRAKSSQSLLDQEVREVQERERELQRQRLALYGSSLPCHPAEDSNEEVPSPPERPSCKKLEVTWPPPSTSENIQVERSPRLLRRQRSALIQRWESGAIGNVETQD
ncbi:uncharacterized protein MISP3 isoform X2 [Pantherophis guttatus]|uniref:Uncharacterized protein MISP3 isoform X2 n=1 Tax=Pantherophis guttatus TaxID=94885 RepID=A0A6P9D4D2_PANGU|nr:uncharacterized protein MISP3 isoform X2 [Pantherophis guttatus]